MYTLTWPGVCNTKIELMLMKAICFDIEATDLGEMLELSVFSYPDKKEIYHSYYHPVRSKEWKTTEAIHHITPAMVADAPQFEAEKNKVQKVVDNCDVIVGFAVGNDLRYLRHAGINIAQNKKVIDVRDLFGLVKGREFGIEYDSAPSLSKCASLVGMDFAEETDAHSATNDTLATLNLLDVLLDCEKSQLNMQFIADVQKRLEEAHEQKLRELARGVIRFIPIDSNNGYKLKNNRMVDVEDVVEGELRVAVESRFMAEHDVRLMFEKRADKFRASTYRLRPADKERFLKYSNVYNPVQEMICRTRYGRHSRSKLGFDVK